MSTSEMGGNTLEKQTGVIEIPNDLILILEESHKSSDYYFNDEQLSRIGKTLGEYLQKASDTKEWGKMMEAALDKISECYDGDDEGYEWQKEKILKYIIKNLTLKQR